jgi:aminoglycoside phosphotransferase (APT) family kinase protein
MAPPTTDDATTARITAWLERRLGGRVASITRQARWRPAWNVVFERPGETLKLHVRCDRESGLETRPLRNEYSVLALLQAHGIPVPELHGWCDDPEAIVMAALDDIPYLGGAHEDPALHRLVEQYVAILARIHRIPVAEAVAAGLREPLNPDEIALAYFGMADRAYRAAKRGPDPLVEFVRKYLFRTIPRHRTRTALLVSDAPQFFHDGTRVTAIYDLELAHIGDPMMDLASLRVRDINEPTGGMTELIRRYARESGGEIDWPALDFHTIASFIAIPMMVGPTLRTNHPHPAFIEYLSWDLGASRAALVVLAETLGVTLQGVLPMVPSASRHAAALDDLVAVCAALPPPAGLMREAAALSLANYARRADQFGAALDRLELDDAETLLGTNFGSLGEAEDRLERFVLDAGPERDADLVRFFHRRILRRLALIQDYPGPIVSRAPTPVDRAAAADA